MTPPTTRHNIPAPTAAHAETFTIGVEDGIIRVWWTEGVTVDDDTAARLVDHVSRIQPQHSLPMLVRLNGMKSLSRCAMQTFARDLDVSAMALLGPSAVDHAIAEFFIQVHRPDYLVRHFTDPLAARLWLTDATYTST
ncbi:DUF7793 family protein [Arthrobacter sp. MDT3-44]